MYYLRTKSAVDAIKFTLNNDKKAEKVPAEAAVAAETQSQGMEVSEFQAMLERSRNASGPEDCEMCGS
jgi:ribonucleoside-diphosphate reductase alpha chain